ncbi:MAG TPA: hypothetical protein VMW78_00755 [Anaerolineae bacterium]|nr:hypothetical protein [Anaerolineae bacterium]
MKCDNCGRTVDRLYQYLIDKNDEDLIGKNYEDGNFEWRLYYFEERDPTDLESVLKYGKKCQYSTQTGVCKKCVLKSDFKKIIKNWIEIFVEKIR